MSKPQILDADLRRINMDKEQGHKEASVEIRVNPWLRLLLLTAHRSLLTGQSPLYIPPSTSTVFPVIYDARSDASQTIVSASSRGSPKRFTGASAAQASRNSCSGFPLAVERAFANSFSRSVAVK